MPLVQYILDARLVLIPALIITGMLIKHSHLIPNKYIPLLLLFEGILFSSIMEGRFSADGIIQGIFVTGVAVLGDQIPKQLSKDD